MYLHDGELCSGIAARGKTQLGYTNADGSRGYMDEPAKVGHGVKNPQWAKRVLTPMPTGTPVTVILDMEERTLSFAIGDAEPQLAYTNLPARVHPYLCSGDKEDNSVLVVCGGAQTSKV